MNKRIERLITATGIAILVGDFIVEVIVTSEGAFTKGKLRIHVEENFHRIGIKKLSRFEVLQYKFKLYIWRLKHSQSPYSALL